MCDCVHACLCVYVYKIVCVSMCVCAQVCVSMLALYYCTKHEEQPFCKEVRFVSIRVSEISVPGHLGLLVL